jgi:hypothetical protein
VYNRYYLNERNTALDAWVELYQGSVEPGSRECRTDAPSVKQQRKSCAHLIRLGWYIWSLSAVAPANA